MNDDAAMATRRVFMTGAAAGIGGALVAGRTSAQTTRPTGAPQPKLPQEPPLPVDRQLGWAVAGLGDFAQGYVIPALERARRAKLTALISGTPDKARSVAAQGGVPPAALYDYNTMARLRDDRTVDVVYIVTPNSTHPELTIRALEAGKHVMCEKPMANSPVECQRMIDAARAANRKLMIAYRAHWEPHNVRVKAMVEAGELGRIAFASADHHRPLDLSLPRDQWRARKAVAGGGSLVDIGIYSLNGLIWLLGEVPTRVAATTHSPGGDPRFAEVENVMTAQLEFPSGVQATISSGYTADKKRIDLWGDKAVAVLDPATSYAGNRLVVSNKEKAEEVLTEQGSEVQFTGEIDHLCEAVTDNVPIRTPGEMGLRDVRIVHALYRAAREKRWVSLAADGSAR